MLPESRGGSRTAADGIAPPITIRLLASYEFIDRNGKRARTVRPPIAGYAEADEKGRERPRGLLQSGVGGSYKLTATSGSGIPVVFSIDPASNRVCSLGAAEATLRFDHAGSFV